MEVLHINCNTGTRALLDMSALALGLVCAYQEMHSCLFYNYYLLTTLRFAPDVNKHSTTEP